MTVVYHAVLIELASFCTSSPSPEVSPSCCCSNSLAPGSTVRPSTIDSGIPSRTIPRTIASADPSACAPPECFRRAPVPPSYVFRFDDHPTIQGLIGSGLAYAVLPLLTVDEHDPNVAIIPIRPAPPPRRLGIAWHPERRPPLALSPFVEAATEICRDLGEQWAASRAA